MDVLGKNAEQGYPYDDAKKQYRITEVDDEDLMKKLVVELERIIPFPKVGKRK